MQAPPNTFEVLGARIRERRKELGMDAKDLVAKARISRRYLNHLENGTRTKMRPRRYADLRTALEVHDDYLLAPPRNDPEKE